MQSVSTLIRAFASGLLVALCSLSQVPAHAAPPEGYNFSPVNQFDINLTAAYWNPIIAYVSERSGVRLNLKIGRTSADTTSYVLAKEVEFVFTNHLFSPQREQLGWKVFGRRNTPPLQAQIVVPEDSPVTDLSQLRGQEVAFAGPEAFIVYKVPYAHLLSSGIDVRVVFAGNQNAAFAQLLAGRVLASGGSTQLVEAYTRREGRRFRVLWASEPFQDLALMASGKVPEADLRKVATAFLEMDKDVHGREVLAQASRIAGLPPDTRFVPASAADYASYRRFYQSAPPNLR